MKRSILFAALAAASAAQAQVLVNPQTVTLDGEVNAARVADLDGDGNQEALYFTGYASDQARAGTLYVADVDAATNALAVRASVTLAGSYLNRSALAVAKGAGGQPIAVAGAGNRLWAVTWNGTSFASSTLATAIANENLIAVDLDGDGVDEIVSHSWSSGGAVYGLGAGGALVERYRFATTAAGYDDLAAGDLNGDGHQDVVVMSGQGWVPNVQVFPGDGAGQLGTPLSISVGVQELTNGVAVGDINGDGRDDLVLSRGRNSPTWLWTYTQDASGVLQGLVQVPSYDIPSDLLIADLDLDGASEVVVEHHGWGRLGVYLTDAAGVIPGEEFVPMWLGNLTFQMLDAGDVDGDGCPDVVVARGSAGGTLVRSRQCVPPPPDTTPDAFVFTDVANVATNTLQTSAPITVTGIDAAAPISVANGSNPNAQTVNPLYSINGGAFVATAGTVQPGDQVRVRQPSSVDATTPQHAVLTIGGVSDTFTSTTGTVDSTPAGFAFVDVVEARRNKNVTSMSITPSSFNTPVPISISGANATYAINNGFFTSAPGTFRPGDRVTLRLVASPSAFTTVTTTLTIGGVSDGWNVRTGSK